MFNKLILAGNLTKDPELRYTPQGLPVVTLRLAATSRSKQGETWKDETLFLDVTVFGKQAENCGQYLNKGSGVLAEGRLRERTWEADGQKKSRFECVATNVVFLPKREGGGAGQQQSDFGSEPLPPYESTDVEPF
ncbi:MAG: single-stranded DNA-binding protein [Nitrospirae bacterium]|uniref:single-stranded DNA-binding protein n=1 Tax=Candidatus Magnetobacterium casense TaxID=1455061 RepID=UPI00058CDA7C|nr:single-stranded DNA-binding protein [Candidatus Magnetobacterium casensis]MBF0336409.1 single-stranded DNA-binding protein [Nitrospirota bacterium]